MKKIFFKAALTVLSIVLFSACTSSGSGESVPGATPAQLVGSWVKVFDSTFEFVQDHGSDAMVFEFTDPNGYLVVFYEQTQQTWEGGQKGTYAVSGSNLVLKPTEHWDTNSWSNTDGSSNWINDHSDYPVLPFVLSGSTLTVTFPFAIPNNSQVVLAKTSFSRRAELVGVWTTAASDQELSFNADGTFILDAGGAGDLAGSNWNASGTESGHIRLTTNDTTAHLVPYTLVDGVLTTRPGTASEKVFMQAWPI